MPGRFPCGECAEQFYDKRELDKHSIKHGVPGRLPCGYCAEQFYDKT